MWHICTCARADVSAVPFLGTYEAYCSPLRFFELSGTPIETPPPAGTHVERPETRDQEPIWPLWRLYPVWRSLWTGPCGGVQFVMTASVMSGF